MKKWDTCGIPSRGNPRKTCGNTGRMPIGGLRVCKQHQEQLEKATPLAYWIITQGIACPEHPRGKLEQESNRIACRTMVSRGGLNTAIQLCSFSAELPEHLRKEKEEAETGQK